MNKILTNPFEIKTNQENKKDSGRRLRLILCLSAAFCLSQLDSLGEMSPFAVSFVSGIPFDYCYCAFIGSAVGYFVSSSWQIALKYTLALLIACLFRLVILKRFQTENNSFVCCLLSFCSCCLASIVYDTFTSFSLFGVILLLSEGVLSAFGTYFLIRAIRTPVLNIGIKKLSAQDSISLVICICVFLMCMSGFTLGSVSPARIAAALFIMFVAHYKGAAASGICGILAGLSFSISPDGRVLFPFFAFGGLVSGVCSTLGQYAVGVSFAVSAFLVSLIDGFSVEKIYLLSEAAIAAVAYCVIPSKAIGKAQDYLDKSGLICDDRVEREVCANLKRAAQNVAEISKIVDKAGERLDKVINPELDKVFAALQQNVCFGCNYKKECWNKCFHETADDIMRITGLKSFSGDKTELEKRCIRPRLLLKETESCYFDFVNAMASKMRISEMRSIVSEQFGVVSELLYEIAEQASNNRVIDTAKSRTVKSALHDSGIDVDSLRYYTDKSSRVTVEADVISGTQETDFNKMRSILQFLTSRRFEKPEIAINELKTSYIFEEKPLYKVMFGSCSLSLDSKKLCGDSIRILTDFFGNRVAVLSDGMGTGSRAAIDSAMTVALMEKLLLCGFTFDSAMRAVNCALMVKSTDESTATVDCLSINVYNAKAAFHKAGAAVSFIRRGNSVTTIEQQSMPLGILKQISPAYAERDLQPGDLVLLVSDGVTVGDCGWISDELLAWSTSSMDALASHIAKLARLRSEENTKDDITVIAARIG